MSSPSTSPAPPAPSIWERILQFIFNNAPTLILPVTIGFLGLYYTNAQKEAEFSLKYLELALNVLNAEPTPSKAEVRKWAISVVDKYSDVKLSQPAQDELQKTPIRVGTLFNLGPLPADAQACVEPARFSSSAAGKRK